jgi:hypothetical protein
MVTVPVKVGEAKFAFKLSAVVTKAVVASVVLLVAAACVIPVVPVGSEGVPLKVGEASGAKAVLVYAFVPRVPPVPMFNVEASVPAKVKLLLAVRVLPSAIVSVDPVAGAVIATLFTEVAEATPKAGVVKTGDVSVLLVSVSVPAKVVNVPVVGSVTFVAAVAVNVVENAPLVAKVLPFAKVRVAEVAGAVIATLFTEVAEATPSVGVVKLGLANGANAVLVYALVPNVPPAPMFRVEASVPAKVKLLLAVRVLPSAIVSVDPVAGAVIATLFTVVAVATPMVGAVRIGEVKVLLVKV